MSTRNHNLNRILIVNRSRLPVRAARRQVAVNGHDRFVSPLFFSADKRYFTSIKVPRKGIIW